MTHHHDQWNVKLGNRIFETAHRGRVDGVSGIADDEQFSQSLPEKHFGGNTAIRARHQYGDRILRTGDFQAPTAPDIPCDGLTLEERRITLLKLQQHLLRGEGRRRGLRRAGRRRRERVASQESSRGSSSANRHTA